MPRPGFHQATLLAGKGVNTQNKSSTDADFCSACSQKNLLSKDQETLISEAICLSCDCEATNDRCGHMVKRNYKKINGDEKKSK